MTHFEQLPLHWPEPRSWRTDPPNLEGSESVIIMFIQYITNFFRVAQQALLSNFICRSAERQMVEESIDDSLVQSAGWFTIKQSNHCLSATAFHDLRLRVQAI